MNVALPDEPADAGNPGRRAAADFDPENNGSKTAVTSCPPPAVANGVVQLSDPASATDGSQTRQDGSKAGNARLFKLEDECAGLVSKSGQSKAGHAKLPLPAQDPPSGASGDDRPQPADWGVSVADRLRTLEAEVAALRQVSLFVGTDDLQSGLSLFDLESRPQGSGGESDDRRLNAELRQLRQSVRELRERVLTQGTILWALEQALREHVVKMEAQVTAVTKRLGEAPDPVSPADAPQPAGDRGNSLDRMPIDAPTLVHYLRCHAEAIRAVCDAVGEGTEAWARAAAVARRHIDLASTPGGEQAGPPPE